MDPAKLEYFRTVKEITGRSKMGQTQVYKSTVNMTMHNYCIITEDHANLCA